MRIVNFGQIIDLEEGKRIAHQITVELDTGVRQQIQTDERTVQQLLDVVTGLESLAPCSVPLPPTFPEGADPATAAVFGENYDAEDYDAGEVGGYAPEGIMGVVADESVATLPVQPRGLGHPPVDSDGYYLPPKAKTVPKDEMGYPIVQREAPPDSVDDEEDDGDQI